MIKSSGQPDTLLGWMGCMADATRLRLVRLLERHELGVVDLCDVLQCPQSTVSRHLKVLADQGWTRSHRRGTTNLYRTTVDDLHPAARKLWELARDQTDDWATVKQDQLRLARRLAERRKGSEDFFEGAAAEWDRLRGELYGGDFSNSALLGLIPSDWIVADLGCGTANLVARIAPHVKEVIGVDQSAAMLKAARKRTKGMKNVDIRRGGLEALPIKSGSCNAAMMLLVLTYLVDPRAALAETRRVLKKGGRVVIVDLLPHDRDEFKREMGQQWMGFKSEELDAMLAEAGLKPDVLHALPPEPEVRGPALFLATAVK